MNFFPDAGHVSQRWVMAVMGMLGVTMAYVMRACLGITLTQMVRPVVVMDDGGAKGPGGVHHDYCPMPQPSSRGQPKSNRTLVTEDEFRNRFDWDEKTQGWVLSSFYYGYILTHLPGGVLSQRFGGKHTMGIGILSTAVFTLLTPHVAYMGSTPLIILRFVEGLGEVTVSIDTVCEQRVTYRRFIFFSRALRSRLSARSWHGGHRQKRKESFPR